MKLLITLVCHNRPAYLLEVLNSLNRVGEVPSVVVLDSPSPEVKSLISRYPIERRLETKLGINYANKRAYDAAIERGADVVLAMEDDTPITPDCIDMVRWFGAQPKYQFMNCFALTPGDMKQSARIRVVNKCCPWGWAFKREGYEKIIHPNWMKDKRGWDVTINELFQREKIPVLEPLVSRTRNIGRLGGQNFTVEYHDRIFTGLIWSDGKKRDYRIQ